MSSKPGPDSGEQSEAYLPQPQSINFSTRRSYGSPSVGCPPTEAVAASCTRISARPLAMLQVPLLFLTCGCSRYVYSINTSVTHAVIPLTVLGIFFYIWFVFVEIASSGCSLQTQYRWLSDISEKMLLRTGCFAALLWGVAFPLKPKPHSSVKLHAGTRGSAEVRDGTR